MHAWCVSFEPVPATTVAPSGRSWHGELDQPQVLVVGQRRRLAGRPADDDAVGAVRAEVAHELDERSSSTSMMLVERRW
jgi:hypothetical protein